MVHSEARSRDMAKALLVHGCLRRMMIASQHSEKSYEAAVADFASGAEKVVQTQQIELLRAAQSEANLLFEPFLAELRKAGWFTERFMIRVPRRVHWQIHRSDARHLSLNSRSLSETALSAT